MSIVLGMTAVGAVGVVYLGRKGWRAFHRMVGITPGTMRYEPKSVAFQPNLIQVNLTDAQIYPLPDVAKLQLQRIDDKADAYQNWRNDIEKRLATKTNVTQSTPKITTSEEHFVLSKLLNEHLPEIVNTYLNINTRQHITVQHDNAHINNSSQALHMLLSLLGDIEKRLDTLLVSCETYELEDLQVMQRYLNSRD